MVPEKLQQKIFRSQKEVRTRGQRKLHDQKLHDLYSSDNILWHLNHGEWLDDKCRCHFGLGSSR
jgi:hypothetical protein